MFVECVVQQEVVKSWVHVLPFLLEEAKSIFVGRKAG